METEELHIDGTDFKGRRIICTESRWKEHIIGDPNHPYMEGAESEVIEAIQDPEYGFRCIDRDYPNRRVYYKMSKSKDYWIKVIVRYKDDNCSGIGTVWTAYMPDEMTDGEIPELLK